VLDPLFHQPARTRIAAFLAARERASFSELKRTTGLTDGNLDAHLKKLIEAGYVDSSELPSTGRSQTAFGLTETGRREFVSYVEALRDLLGLSRPPPPPRRTRGRRRGGA
jgi:DNA-binding MarR family transcriptional regulator